jgi:putative ABC transport system permease protein
MVPAIGFHPGMLSLALLSGMLAIAVTILLLKTDWGLMLRTVGPNPRLVEGLGRRPALYVVTGLASANVLVACAGALTASYQQFVDVNMGAGIVVTFAAAMVFGEQILRAMGVTLTGRTWARVAAAPAGMIAYYLLYLLVLRASSLGVLRLPIQPSDIKLTSALALAGGSWLASRRLGEREEGLPI